MHLVTESQPVTRRWPPLGGIPWKELPGDPACWEWPVDPDLTKHVGKPAQAICALRDWQAGRCAVCGLDKRSRMVEDHEHATGLTRGFLCWSCNQKEPLRGGLFDRYRERPPTVMLGLRINYASWRNWKSMGGAPGVPLPTSN